MSRLVTLIFLFVVSSIAVAEETFPVTELKFQKIFAQRSGDDKDTYCLLGNGFFRTISSNEESTLISDWLQKHPNAKTVPVSIVGEGSKMPIIYIWVIDGEDSLNLSLVKSGAFPGSVMIDAVQFEKLSRGSSERANIEAGVAYAGKMNPNLVTHKETPPRRLISDSSYELFLMELQKAQDLARSQKNSIWSDKFKELRGE